MNRKGFALLGLAALAVGIENFLYFRSEEAASREPAEELPAESAPRSRGAPLAQLSRGTVDAYLATLPAPGRNPFLTLAEWNALAASAEAGAADLPRLAGTLTSPERRSAWIDGRIAREGDRVRGRELLRIERRAVWLDDDPAPLRIDLLPGADAALRAAEAELEHETREVAP